MKLILPLIVIGSLFVAGCNADVSATAQLPNDQPKQSTTTAPKKRNIRPETESALFSNNQLVCINGSLYFAAWEEGGVVIRSPVIDPVSPNNNAVMQCTGGYQIDQFSKLY